ncbi:hypothetical protein N7537_011925 [Penicillium hordei]|uniref:Tat pathway signal sequence n=1 Tax=Penicillium hordei TaxID=40994 RepID=A0AAD6GU04_9EURO|nr:uncharacterized protein N7537_011925 [Penicillium hordei]KAJ5589247.1 hypothetical protein N7537_011925 [Penicillium hordei]
MAPIPEKYHLLKDEDDSSTSHRNSGGEELTGHAYLQRQEEEGLKSRFSRKVTLVIVAVLFGASILSNILMALALTKTHDHVPSQRITKYAGLADDHPVAWQASTPYSTESISESDHAWVNMEIDYINVALSKEEAKEKGLPPSANFPWDTNYSVYMITSMHSLHCLKSLHRSNLEYRKGVKQSYPTEHLIHCLDNVRQDIMCAADDTPRYIPVDATGTATTAVGQYRQCKDWEKLRQWSKANDACFSYNELIRHELLEDQPFPHALRFCSRDSKFLPTVQKFYNQSSDWVPVKPDPPYPEVGVQFDGYDQYT